LGRVDGDLWTAPTPCEGWAVRDLVDHAVAVQRRYAEALGCALPDDAGWPIVRDALAAALAADAAFAATVVSHRLLGEVRKPAVLGVVTDDLLVHTWDLARAIGADEALPLDAVVACYEAIQLLPPEVARSPGVFGPALEVDAGASPQVRLLAYVGRRA
jgi:uncharacterized protein (TIGR03086 family)